MKRILNGNSVQLIGFGIFAPEQKTARQGRNPQTGETKIMKKSFYIVPSTKSYHTVIDAKSSDDALISFAETMDSNISAYFKATEEKPKDYPHGYEYPDGKFQVAMSVIVATMTNDDKSPYYIKEGLGNIDLSNMDMIAKLQETYDMLCDTDKKIALKFRGKFYKILRSITGYQQPAQVTPMTFEDMFAQAKIISGRSARNF